MPVAAPAVAQNISFQDLCATFPAVSQKKHIAIIPGDGVGREVIPQAVNVVKASGAGVEMTDFDWGADRYLRDAVTVPADGLTMLAREFDAIELYGV